MNRGNTKIKNLQGVDAWVEKLNKKFSYILGKRDRQPPNKKISNLTFSVVVISFLILLWSMTGFYYLPENKFGLILQNGRVLQVVKGLKVGFAMPYPFGSIEVIDASVSDSINLMQMGITDNGFMLLSSDLAPIKVDAKFNYQVIDPKLLFKRSLQQFNLNNLVASNIQVKLHDYFVDKSKDDILKSNLTVVAGEIKNNVNQKLTTIGIQIIKLNINSLGSVVNPTNLSNKIESSSVGESFSLSSRLLAEANQYKTDLLVQTKVDIDKFDQLLKQYKLNPKAVVDQMYYSTLDDISVTKLNTKYPLLNLSLTDLIQRSKSNLSAPLDSGSTSTRHFGREVARERNNMAEVQK